MGRAGKDGVGGVLPVVSGNSLGGGGGGERGAEIGRKGDKLFPNDIVKQQNKVCFSLSYSPLF